jgi:hypothetical protein
MLVKEKFLETILQDEQTMNKIPNLRENHGSKEVVSDLYNLCRQTFLAQYNCQIINEEDKFLSFISNDEFTQLGIHVKSFLSKLNNDNNEIVFDGKKW